MNCFALVYIEEFEFVFCNKIKYHKYQTHFAIQLEAPAGLRKIGNTLLRQLPRSLDCY